MMTQKMPTSALLLFLLLLLTFLRPSFSTRRRILHQPFQPQDSSPPSKPPIPSPPASPKYPFSGSTPADSDSPFFPSYPSSPLPPSSSSSQASFPANVSSLSVPRASGPSSASSKLAVAAIAAVIAAVAVVSLAAFLHLRRRSRSRGSSSFDRSKTQRSDSSSAVSFSNHHIPKLPRPPQTSSEFLYLGTLVSSHAPAGGAAAFNNASSASAATNQSNASSDSRKTDSPELRPLPPLITRQVPRANSGDAANVESEEFYSPKGSVNGRGSSIDTGSASRRAFAAVDLADFNGSASPTYSSSSSVPGSGPGSPVRSHSSRYSIPDSPDLIEIQTISPSSSSPEKDSRRSVESSPRISEYNTESQSPVKLIAAIPSQPEIEGSLFPESAPALLYSRRSEESESSPTNSGFSDLKLESPPRIPTDSVPEIRSPESISSPIQSTTIEIPIPPPPQEAQVQESASLPTTCSTKCEQSTPRNSIDSPEIIAETSSTLTPTPPQMQNSELPTCEESPPRIQHNAATSFPPPPPPPPPPPKSLIEPPGLVSPIELPSDLNGESSIRTQHNAATFIPPPPPPPPRKVWESPKTPTPPVKRPIGPPSLINPLRPISFESPTSMSPMELPSNDPQMDNKDFPNQETEYSREDTNQNGDSNSNTLKPKLKQLHWDKVRASSDREMVWDQFKCSSFKLNEEMIETLFVANTPKPKPNPNESTRWQVLPLPGHDNGNRVLDPKKAQNIAILLKALHVTVDEVCEGLLEGNADILGTDLLESLLKMAPTKEEERKLQEYEEDDDKDSPTKLGPAERFLKAVVDIPYAFKRVEAMLYISTFDSEVEYLKKSFETLESACEELRSSRMFLKLLEAVLKTGNRMNVGTNRGDAHAFKLDTLLKLADVKAADGKTTLLHFVVQEIIRTEGSHPNNDDARCRKLVSSLSSELSNVKKAAVMDAEVVSADVAKLSKGIENVKEMIGKIGLDGGEKFWENMRGFVRKGEEEIFRVRAQESLALSLVKEITEYFHGDSGKEEAHPFRIFVVVREFLGVLDRVCKEVGMINERTVVSSPHMFPVPVNPMLQQAASGMFSID